MPLPLVLIGLCLLPVSWRGEPGVGRGHTHSRRGRCLPAWMLTWVYPAKYCHKFRNSLRVALASWPAQALYREMPFWSVMRVKLSRREGAPGPR